MRTCPPSVRSSAVALAVVRRCASRGSRREWKGGHAHAKAAFCSVSDHLGLFAPQVFDLDAVTAALRRCGRSLETRRGISIHGHIEKRGLCADVLVSNNLMAMYSDFVFIDCAERVFGEMPHRNVVSWTTLISAQIRSGRPDLAIGIFIRMLDEGSEEPNGFTYSAALKSCSMVGNLSLGKWIHEHALKNGYLQADVVLMNAVLDMYVKCGSLGEARRVFDGFPLANSTSWNTMISGYSKEGNALEAENLFHKFPRPDAISYNTLIASFAEIGSPKALEYVHLMQSKGFKLDHYTFPCALKTCGKLKFEEMGKQIHCRIIRCGFLLSCFIGSSLIDMYSNCGRMGDAIKLYEECSDHKSCISVGDRLSLLNSMLSGFVNNGYNNHALQLIPEIHSSGTQLDHFTFSSALQLCSNMQSMTLGIQVHGLLITSGFHRDHIVGSNLVDLYSRCGSLVDALRLFQNLPHKDIVAWTGLITGCLRQGANELVLKILREVILSKTEADHFLVSSVLKACSGIPCVQAGKQVHAYIVKGGFESESITDTSLIDMYAKCGEVEDGFRAFEFAVKKDTICWTGIIAGCGNNGKATRALELFQEMVKAKVEPNEITLLSVLSACRHAGLVEEACRIFMSMEESYGLKPWIEHYHCMIDILCRAGLFVEAKKLISEIPYEHDEAAHKSLLNCCLIHQNSEIGKLAQVDLFQYGSCGDTSGFVTLSNAYAIQGLWDVSAKCREIGRRLNIKNAGKSWLQVGTQ